MAGDTQNGNGRGGNRWSRATRGVAALLLLLPLVANRFSDEVAWDPGDFIVMGAMLFAACVTYELATRISGSTAYRAAVGIAIVAAFLLVWINLAVGIIDSEDNRANLVFAGVLAVGLLGALATRFEPRGMARTMVAMAIAQMLVAVFALFAAQGNEGSILSMCFAAVWLGSAQLFRKAARAQMAPGPAQ